jgi:hypothetical protein
MEPAVRNRRRASWPHVRRCAGSQPAAGEPAKRPALCLDEMTDRQDGLPFVIGRMVDMN